MADLTDIILLGDPRLYEKCTPVQPHEVEELKPYIRQMAELVLAFREKYGAGRAIAAPQIGLMKRLVVMNIDQPIPFFNPVLHDFSEEKFEMWDDCMSFPNLLIKLERYKACKMTFRDIHWKEQVWMLEGDLSELLQHECDHLDGVLATMRAIDQYAFRIKSVN